MLLLLVTVLVFFWLLRRALTGRNPGPGGPAAKTSTPVSELVACAHCGVLLPRDEALAGPDEGASKGGIFFCTEEHLKLGRR